MVGPPLLFLLRILWRQWFLPFGYQNLDWRYSNFSHCVKRILYSLIGQMSQQMVVSLNNQESRSHVDVGNLRVGRPAVTLWLLWHQRGGGGFPEISLPGPNESRVFNPGISRTEFCKILGFRDFSGRDLPEISIPGFYQKSPGSLRITFSAYKFGQFHTFWTAFLLVEDPWRIFTSSCFLWSGSTSPSSGERVFSF